MSLYSLPNILTFGRIGLIPLICMALFQGNTGWAFFLFLIACITDFADGYTARAMGVPSSFGALLDPLADKLLLFSVCLFAAQGGHLSGSLVWLFACMCARELIVASLRSSFSHEKLPVIYAAKGKTFFQMLAIGGVLMPYTSVREWTNFFVPWATWIALLLSVYSGIFYGWKSWISKKD